MNATSLTEKHRKEIKYEKGPIMITETPKVIPNTVCFVKFTNAILLERICNEKIVKDGFLTIDELKNILERTIFDHPDPTGVYNHSDVPTNTFGWHEADKFQISIDVLNNVVYFHTGNPKYLPNLSKTDTSTVDGKGEVKSESDKLIRVFLSHLNRKVDFYNYEIERILEELK